MLNKISTRPQLHIGVQQVNVVIQLFRKCLGYEIIQIHYRAMESNCIILILDGSSPAVSELPDIFSGNSFYFHGIDDERASLLKRYIIAYPFPDDELHCFFLNLTNQ